MASRVIQQHPHALGVWHRTTKPEEVGGIGGRAINKLTDLRIRSFVRQSREGTATTRKLADGGGLYLLVTPAGTAVWRVKYRFGGKERVFAAGSYPTTTASPEANA